MDDLLAEFVAESAATLLQMDRAILDLERSPDSRGTLSLMFRLIHTTKGRCGFLGLSRLERLAHAAEDVLETVRDEGVGAVPAVIEGMLAAIGGFRSILHGIATSGTEPPGDDEALLQSLRTLAVPGLIDPVSFASATPERMGRSMPPVVDARLRPLAHAWNGLPALVRALASDLGKSIELVMEEVATELDRLTVQQVAGSLTHIVRNSADHGLEPPADRLACGKPAAGTIRLTATEADGLVVLTVADDGRGLARERIRAEIIAQGLAGPREVAAMSDAAIAQFIFRPGFSTSSDVTSISGRGVGLDAAKAGIEDIGGTIEVASVDGSGTSFRLTFPSKPILASGTVTASARRLRQGGRSAGRKAAPTGDVALVLVEGAGKHVPPRPVRDKV